VRVALSTGTSFGAASAWTSWGSAYADYQLADVNRDGRADLIGRNASTGDVQVATSTGTRFRSSGSWGYWGGSIASS
jgi:hypothetical protein